MTYSVIPLSKTTIISKIGEGTFAQGDFILICSSVRIKITVNILAQFASGLN